MVSLNSVPGRLADGPDPGQASRADARRIRRPAAWPFALPTFVALALVLFLPLLYNIWVSLHVERLALNDGQFTGLGNYRKILQNGQLLGTVRRTLVFTFGSLLLQFAVGFASALALESFPRASRVIRPMLLTPWVMPGVAIAALWLAILNPLTGLANRVDGLLGIGPVEWLTSPKLAMACLIVVNTWKGSPYWILMLSAGLKSIPSETLEAARVDGASYLQVLWNVILPAIRPVLGVTAALAFLWTFNYFDLAYLLTDGGPDGATTTLPFAIWEASLKFNRFDQGAAYSVLSVILTSIAIVVYIRLTRTRPSDG